jgi:putative PEP-CTERM system TPR-repeat lipoprotein
MTMITLNHLKAPARALRHSIALAALLVASAGAALAADTKAAQYYEDALVRYEKKDLAGAIIQLKNALQADSRMLPVHVLLGKALFASGQAPAAEVAFNEALQQGVNRAEVVVLLARALVAQGKQLKVVDPQQFPLAGLPAGVQAQLLLVKAAAHGDLGDSRSALKAIEDSRAADPTSAEAWLAEVPVRIRARQLKEALAAVAKARELDPKSAAVHYQTGSVLHVQGDIKSALVSYDKALAIAPDYVDARVTRAGLYIDLKRPDDAAKDVIELLGSHPQDPRGWYLSALLAEREGKQQDARASLAKITALLDPLPIEYIRYRPQILLLNGQAHYGLGEREKAKPYFESFQKAQPGSPVSKMLASIYLAEGNQDRAAESLEQYLRSFPNDAQATALLASAYMAKGRNARAAELMQRALRTSDAPELYTAYGLSLLGSGQNDNATAQLETAYKKDPGQTQAAYALVGLYLRGNQVPKAMAVTTALVKRQPANPSFQNLLGLAKLQARDLAGARTAFEQALKLDPTMLQASIHLARLEADTGNFDRAQQLLDGVLKAEEVNTEAMYEQGVLAERRARPDEALRWLQRAYDIAGAKDLRASLALVDLHLRAGRRAEALKVAQQLSSSLPDNLPVLLALVRAQLANADLPGARATLTTATRVAAYDTPVQVELALLQMAARNVPGAAYNLDKALSAKPDYFPAQVLMTEVETVQGDYAKAEQRAGQIVRQAPKLAIGYSLQGDLAMARKQLGPAIEAYRRAHQAQPSADTLRRLFAAMARQDPKAALQMGEQWIAAHPKDLTARKMLAETYVRSNNLPAARSAYQRLNELAPTDAGVLNDLANVLLRIKDPKAADVADKALSVDPNNPVIIDTAGWAAYQAGKFDRALQLLRDARLREPQANEIRYHLASALVKKGRRDEARVELEAALRSKAPFDGHEDAQALLQTLK